MDPNPKVYEWDGLIIGGEGDGGGAFVRFPWDLKEAFGKANLGTGLWHDTAPRVVETPADLEAALADQPVARATWDRLSNSHRREYVRWIEDAKKAETRTSRVAKAIVLLNEGRPYK